MNIRSPIIANGALHHVAHHKLKKLNIEEMQS
jgi:hypothetical protein